MKNLKRNILITGGAGYIGQNMISLFLKQNYHISVIDNLSTSKSINKSLKRHIFFYKLDLTKKEKIKNFFKNKNFDLIIHLAAFSGVKEFNKNVSGSFRNNVIATKNLLDYGFENKNTKLIFASSAAVYGKVSNKKVNERNTCRPINHYGLSKLTCENLIKDSFKNPIKQHIMQF